MDAVVVKNLKKHYGSVKAVKGLSFSIKKGEIFGLLGPNGAGKTTTMGCICQLATISSGSISVEGFDVVEEYLDARMQIGLSPQELSFDPYFTVIETLLYQGGYFGMRKAAALKRAKELLKEFGLWEKRKSAQKELSGGMKRKVSIIKALMHTPKVLILDEPTAGLDVDSRYELWRFIEKLNKKGMTIILTTHYIEEAEKLCDRICIISSGKILKLEDTSTMIEELSQNIIKVHLDEGFSEDVVRKGLSAIDYMLDGRDVSVRVLKKDQNKMLRSILTGLDEAGIGVTNFGIEQDNLENIFRRIVGGGK